MPKSKRNKQIELAKTKKRGLEWKKRLFEEVRSCVDKYKNVLIFSVNDMRNNKMKTVREQWKHSRFFIGKNKIMAMALGRFAEEEYKPNLHKLGQQIKGQRGLLFSNKPIEEIISWFRSYSEGDYARSGNTAIETVHLPAGPLTKFPHNLEPYLRQLGLPTTLERGVIHLIKDHEVCKSGDILTPETAKILKLLGYEMAEFHITIDCVWSQDGTFMQLTEKADVDAKENRQQKKNSFLSSTVIEKNSLAEDEQMEIEQNDEEESDIDESEEESEKDSSYTLPNIVKSPLHESITVTSTPKLKTNDVTENGESKFKEIDEKVDLEDIPKEIDDKSNEEEITEKVDDENNEELTEKIDDINNEEKITEKDKENHIEKLDDINNIEEISEKIDDESSEVSKAKTPASKKGRPYLSTKTPKSTKKLDSSKRESLLKTPDANTSQDSPIFRELRNRSVKFSRKKKK